MDAAHGTTVVTAQSVPKGTYASAPTTNEKKFSGRGISSSIWANTAPAARKFIAARPNGNSCASVVPQLPVDGAIQLTKLRQLTDKNDTSTMTSAHPTSTNLAPRLADAITIISSVPPSPIALDIGLGHILAFPLYDLLLQLVCNNQPTLLRQFLGPADPGPGHWRGSDCLTLLLKGWPFGLQASYLADQADGGIVTPHAAFEALSWLRTFLLAHGNSSPAQQDTTSPVWQSIEDRFRAIEAVRIVFMRNSPSWWLDSQHLHIMGQLIDRVNQDPTL